MNLESKVAYSTRVSTNNGDIGFGSNCTRTDDSRTLSGTYSYTVTFTLEACDTTGGTVTATLRQGASDVVSTTQSVTVTSRPNRPPTFNDGTSTTRSIEENVAAGTGVFPAVEADDPDDDPLTYSLSGTDSSSFSIVSNSGLIRTRASLNYETKSSYSVDVKASDGEDDSSIAVTINVINLDEPGQVSFPFGSAPEVGTAFTATLADTDGGVYGEQWQWQRSTAGSPWIAINNAILSDYTPEIGDAGHQLRATVSYTDDHASGKSATSAASSPVIVPFPTFGNAPTVSVGADRTSIVASYTLPADPSFDYEVAALRSETGSFAPGSYVLASSTFNNPSSWNYSPSIAGWYKVALRACTDRTASLCGPYVHSTDTPFKLPPPRDLSVTPLPQRRALLTWGFNPNSSSYTVQVRETGTSAWDFPSTGHEPSGTRSMPEYEIALDVVTTSSGGTTAGFADADAFQFRARANASTGFILSSEYGDFITIIDTPITEANGNSPGSQGQAKLSWRTISSVLGDASYFGGTYSFRYRIVGGDHTQLAWRPGTYVSDETVDQTQMMGTNRDTIGGLTREAIYAIQLRYEKTGTSTVYAARDVYVWPSGRVAGGGERVATFPLNHPLSNKTYSYVVCEETFPSGKESDWKKFISHAISQWDLATKNLVTTERVEGDCADYSVFVDEVIAAVKTFAMGTNLTGIPPTDSQIAAHARALLSNFDQSGIATTRMLDSRLNEVLMIDDDPSDILVRVAVFKEVSEQVGHGWCDYACAQRSGSTVDIRLMRSHFDMLNLNVPGADDTADPGEIPFNSCDPVVNEYGVVVHEAGHALGITGGVTGRDQGRFHPHIEDSVMGRNKDATVNCSPHPFDIMAIEALYQGR